MKFKKFLISLYFRVQLHMLFLIITRVKFALFIFITIINITDVHTIIGINFTVGKLPLTFRAAVECGSSARLAVAVNEEQKKRIGAN